eukprot:5564490-Amphidinium_carterae.2
MRAFVREWLSVLMAARCKLLACRRCAHFSSSARALGWSLVGSVDRSALGCGDGVARLCLCHNLGEDDGA